ncbi:MAG: hypothetical protein Q4E69_02605 [Bacilli bacterium]|nr:hypothetical protein [Bacilli bacterium]
MKKDELRDKDFDPFIDKKKKSVKDITLEDDEEKEEKPKKKRKSKVKKERIITFTKLDSVDTLLIVIFVCMLVLTIFLGFKVAKAKKEFKDYKRASIVVPVLAKDTNNNISVDISNMKKGDSKEYTFKVSNNKDNNINPDEVVYALQLVNTDSVSVEVYKNNSKDNILPGSNIILDNKLKKDEEQIDVFTLKIKAVKKTSDKELITIKIIS